MWLGQRQTAISPHADDHPDLLEACTRRDQAHAANTAAQHLARVALTLITQVDPSRDPATIREALRLVTVGSQEAISPRSAT
jgi:DNA-binding FadR family transcriptional regulator